MTAGELRKALEFLPDEAEVYVAEAGAYRATKAARKGHVRALGGLGRLFPYEPAAKRRDTALLID